MEWKIIRESLVEKSPIVESRIRITKTFIYFKDPFYQLHFPDKTRYRLEFDEDIPEKYKYGIQVNFEKDGLQIGEGTYIVTNSLYDYLKIKFIHGKTFVQKKTVLIVIGFVLGCIATWGINKFLDTQYKGQQDKLEQQQLKQGCFHR